jgi:hypothetical protein
MRYKLLLLFFLLNVSAANAHQDFWTYKTFGKVKARIKTGFSYEEIKKVWIIGELVNDLRKTLQYDDTIFIDFNHYYIGDCEPDYFISYDDGSITETGYGETNRFLTKKALVIREVSHKLSAMTTLQLAEYAINNLSAIKQKQKQLKYDKNYCNWLINTIDTSFTRSISVGSPSAIVTEILKKRIYRPESGDYDSNDISYFFQNNKYYIFYKHYKNRESVLLITDNVYQFKTLTFDKAIIFDTDSTFHYISGVNRPGVSRKWTLKDTQEFYRPYEIEKVGSSKIAISFWSYATKDRTAVYRIDKNQLVQDLNKELDR